METLVRIADALGRFSARYVPSAFAIAVLLTLLAFGLGLTRAGAAPMDVVKGWGGGFWELLSFSMRMAARDVQRLSPGARRAARSGAAHGALGS
ncbi:TIGR00366 family protein [Sorangium sp. KYC3313]|uniref:TIGR00366 family protein n=1 Tax=Sorangium sp. KYC3313 TaxID=3449740 RepID=UPI003F8B6718